MVLDVLQCVLDMVVDFDDDWISLGFVKMFMDGVIDSGMVFLLCGDLDQFGLFFVFEWFNQIVIQIDWCGLQIVVYVIGDGVV